MPRYRVGVQIVMTGDVEFDADNDDHAEELREDVGFIDDLLADQDTNFDRGVQVDSVERID